MMNYAVKYYDLKSNPCHKAGNMGKNKAAAMPYWTLEEFNEFADAIIDKRASWTMFNVLFWTGMRLGEMLALTVKDINVNDMSIDINKSLTRVDGELLITPPKTEASVRTITIGEIPKELNLLFTKWKDYAEKNKEDYYKNAFYCPVKGACEVFRYEGVSYRIYPAFFDIDGEYFEYLMLRQIENELVELGAEEVFCTAVMD